MHKWDHLLESDATRRAAERRYKASSSSENAIKYAIEILRAHSRNQGARFERLLQEFEDNQSEDTATALILDYDRVTGPRDVELSRTTRLKGKMGNRVHQANQTEITTKYFTILVSYRTPVAYVVRASGDGFHTNEHHSVTTTQHIRRWTSSLSKPVSQDELDDIYGAVS